MNDKIKNSEITRKDFLYFILITAGVSVVGGCLSSSTAQGAVSTVND